MNSPEAEARILIIGYGNTLRGDDGLGPVAAERLCDLLPERLAQVIPCHQLLPELTEPLSRVDLAIFIDACCDLPPGELSCKPVEPRADVSGSMTHHLDPPTLLALSHRLFGHLPQAYLITVGGASFDLLQGLSPLLQSSLDHVIAQVHQLIRVHHPQTIVIPDSMSLPPQSPSPDPGRGEPCVRPLSPSPGTPGEGQGEGSEQVVRATGDCPNAPSASSPSSPTTPCDTPSALSPSLRASVPSCLRASSPSPSPKEPPHA